VISKPAQLACNELAIVHEDSVENSPHVLNHHGARFNLLNDPYCCREKVTLVRFAELLPGNREWRAGKSATYQIDTLEFGSIELSQVRLHYVPVGAVEPQSFATIRVNLDKTNVINAR
jgi:hypothetical protein